MRFTIGPSPSRSVPAAAAAGWVGRAIAEQGSLPTMEAAQGVTLTGEQRRDFAEDGYLILDDPCEPELLDAVREEAEPLLQDQPELQEHLENRYRATLRDGCVGAVYVLD
jgi:hypothetical protein